MKDRRAAEARGRGGEARAAWYLRSKGWRILAQRVRTPAGEVDLVARKGRLVAFVEVKTRGSLAELDHAIDEHRLARVAAAAEILLPRFLQEGDDCRIDVVLIAPRAWPRHIENAWMG
jgi:putative endonuclease